MSDLRKAAEKYYQFVESLFNSRAMVTMLEDGDIDKFDLLSNELSEVLAQPEPEPYGYIIELRMSDEHHGCNEALISREFIHGLKEEPIAIYTKPPAPRRLREDVKEIIEAVAYVGVNFGFGAYEIEQKHIECARRIIGAITKER